MSRQFNIMAHIAEYDMKFKCMNHAVPFMGRELVNACKREELNLVKWQQAQLEPVEYGPQIESASSWCSRVPFLGYELNQYKLDVGLVLIFDAIYYKDPIDAVCDKLRNLNDDDLIRMGQGLFTDYYNAKCCAVYLVRGCPWPKDDNGDYYRDGLKYYMDVNYYDKEFHVHDYVWMDPSKQTIIKTIFLLNVSCTFWSLLSPELIFIIIGYLR